LKELLSYSKREAMVYPKVDSNDENEGQICLRLRIFGNAKDEKDNV